MILEHMDRMKRGNVDMTLEEHFTAHEQVERTGFLIFCATLAAAGLLIITILKYTLWS